jgi:hypothetical protein
MPRRIVLDAGMEVNYFDRELVERATRRIRLCGVAGLVACGFRPW